jgi:hypothetical protein
VTTVSDAVSFSNTMGTVTVEAGRETVAEPGKKPGVPKSVDTGKAAEDFTQPEAAYNLIKNPGFESGLKDWGPTYFNFAGKRHTEADASVVHSGRASLRFDAATRLQGAKPGLMRFALQDVTVVPGKSYLFKFYIRAEIREGNITPRFGLGGAELPDAWTFPVDKTWKMKSMRVVARDKNFTLGLEALLEGERYEGSLWVDNLLLTELPTPAKPK